MAAAVVIIRIAIQRIKWIRRCVVLAAIRVVRAVAWQLSGAVLASGRTVRFGRTCGRSVGMLSYRLTMNTLNTSNRSLHNARPVVHRVADGVGRQSGVDVRMTVERMMGICCGEERERTKLERMNYFLEKENF